MKRKGPPIQNIPVRTEEGDRIRDAFRSKSPLTSANYAQIELRILSLMAEEESNGERGQKH